MKLFKSKYGIKYRIARLIMLGFFIAGSVVLIVESATPGPESGRKSDATGIAISNVINDIKGDVATEIFPEECHISVKKTEFFVGESVTLTVNTLPEDSTYKSYIYTSSDEEVATVRGVRQRFFKAFRQDLFQGFLIFVFTLVCAGLGGLFVYLALDYGLNLIIIGDIKKKLVL